jgi:predicted enzyme related to lactoylglutathione lyase
MASTAASPVFGLGGVFLRVKDPEALYQWYEKHLGLVRQHGCFTFEPDTKPGAIALSFFTKENKYFDTAQPAMLNFRVADLDALLASLGAAGVSIDPKRDDYDFGRFAWITDPEGNRVELWQPID